MYHVLVVGAGYTGSRIARYFKDQKQKVWAVTRTGKRNDEFEKGGITPVIADLTRTETLAAIPPVHFIVLCPAPDEGSEENYRKIYIEGIQNFLHSRVGKPRPSFILYISSTAVWRPREGGWVDENTAPDPETEKGRILAQAEKNILESGYPSAVFRLAGIYGPGRNRLRVLESGKISQEENSYMNMIHVDDVVRAVPVLFKKGAIGEVYTGVDDRPVLRSDFYRELGELTGKKVDFNFLGSSGGKKCRNTKLKMLGFEFLYPTFREGYESLLNKTNNL